MEDIFSNFIDVILYLLGSIFCIVVLIVFYFQIRKWLKKQRRRNRRKRYENYKIRKANRKANK
jgi:uncharacterized membrane protein